jgi:predicted regulator of Ras-like GTPase activity (Roadblock/LC7/MglB family)
MQDIAKLNNIVGKLSKLEDVTTVFAASRAGVFAMGMTPKMTDRAMFSAITSMMLGAAEQIGREMGDELGHMALHLNDSNMLILGAGNKHLVGLVLVRNCNLQKIVADAKTIIASG